MLTTKQLDTASPRHDAGALAARPVRTRAPYYLVGEHERSSAKPAGIACRAHAHLRQRSLAWPAR